jgi:hypothetical protein
MRLLISARDPGAAFHLIEITKAAHLDEQFNVKVVAQSPAFEYIYKAGVDVNKIDLPKATKIDDSAAKALRRKAAELLAGFKPDAVLCGLSTPFDGGIDEALLAEAQVPTFLFQDFWGEQNSFFGKQADHFLVLDEEASRLSRMRHNSDSLIVGSPRHSFYSKMDIGGKRTELRRQFGIADDIVVYGFFGQALRQNPGYVRTAQAWAEAMADFPENQLAAYKPHPLESDGDLQETLKKFEETGNAFLVMEKLSVEDALLICDVSCSVFSNCTYDAAYLNWNSPGPLITPVSLFFEEEIAEYYQNIVHMREFPYLKAGLAMLIDDREKLQDLLVEASQPETKHLYWEAAKKWLADPTEAPKRVLDSISHITSKAL